MPKAAAKRGHRHFAAVGQTAEKVWPMLPWRVPHGKGALNSPTCCHVNVAHNAVDKSAAKGSVKPLKLGPVQQNCAPPEAKRQNLRFDLWSSC